MIRSLGQFAVLTVWALTLTACTLVSPYDETIDKGLTNYQEAIEVHYAKMQTNVIPRDYASSKPFYAEQLGGLAVLLNRAKATDEPAGCPTIKGLQALSDKAVGELEAAAGGDLRDQIQGAVKEALQDINNVDASSCTVVVLSLLMVNHEKAELIHKKNDPMNDTLIDLTRSSLSQSVRIALRNELGKKLAE